jgi:hypothetical protein
MSTFPNLLTQSSQCFWNRFYFPPEANRTWQYPDSTTLTCRTRNWDWTFLDAATWQTFDWLRNERVLSVTTLSVANRALVSQSVGRSVTWLPNTVQHGTWFDARDAQSDALQFSCLLMRFDTENLKLTNIHASICFHWFSWYRESTQVFCVTLSSEYKQQADQCLRRV